MKDYWQKILVVDDSRVVRISLREVLESAGYEVTEAEDGQQALTLIKTRGIPHLALVDLHMPRMDGFTFCKKVHQFCDMPVIMLTSEDDETTVVQGLEEHAEDYVVKPFRKQELVARIKRVLGRMESYSYTFDPIIEIDERLAVDLPNRKAFVETEKLSLTPTEAKLLYILIKSAGRTVSTEYLLQRVWPLEDAFEDRLHAHIYRLRKKIEVDPKSPTYVVSDWGKGYTFPPKVKA